MRKTSLILSGVMLGLLLVLFIYNQFDIQESKFEIGEDLDTSSVPAFLNDLFGEASFDKKNGYYRLWSLTEPPDVDIESDEIFIKYRKLHDPQYDNEKCTKEWIEDCVKKGYPADKPNRGDYLRYHKKLKEILAKSSKWFHPIDNSKEDLCQYIITSKQEIKQLISIFKVHLERYQKLVECELFEDFTLVVKDSKLNINAWIPNLLAWLNIGKVYITANMLRALEGDWNLGVSNLLKTIDMTKMSIKNSRTLILNLVGKAIMRQALQGLVSLMNQKDCPTEVFRQVMKRLPVINYMEYGNKKGFLAEGISVSQTPLKGGFLVQKRRTQQYYYDFFSRLYTCDKTAPYTWETTPMENQDLMKGWFWWIQNPRGKVKFMRFIIKHNFPNFFMASYRGYHIKTVHDMTRIAAELHLNYTPDKPVLEILQGLKGYQNLLDPGSGKPYIWNEEKQILYSIGIDRQDNKGVTNLNEMKGSDFAIPVILYVK
jgi:hypothetical protein